MMPLLDTFEIVDRKTGEVVKTVRGRYGSVFNYYPEYDTSDYQFRELDKKEILPKETTDETDA